MYYFKIKCSMLFFFCVYVILCFGSGNKVNFLFFFLYVRMILISLIYLCFLGVLLLINNFLIR